MNKQYIIAVDFDGTCVTHDYPNVGQEIGATRVLKAIADAGHKLILFTMRCGKELADAENWFTEKDIPLFGVNGNPSQYTWTVSPKPYAHIYIDDAGLGCPLKFDGTMSTRPFVNWEEVEQYLIDWGVLND